MNPRNLRRTKAFVLVPIAALTASVVALEARDGVTPTTIRSDAAATTPGAAATSTAGPTSGLAAPTTVATPPVTTAAGAVEAPASVTRAGAAAGGGLPPLRGRAGIPGASLDTAVDAGSTSGIPSVALAAYQRAASVIDQADSGCKLDWQLLAAIGEIESGNGTSGGSQLSSAGIASPAIYGPVLNGRKHTARIPDTDNGAIDGDKRFDRAVGPMQILPGTWVQIAVDGDGDGRRDPQDINDAALASAVYLCSTGTDLSTTAARTAALLRYNHSSSYAARVLAIAASYSSADQASTIPATLMLPPGAGSTTPTGTAAGSPKAKHKHRDKRGKHHGKERATGLKQDGAAQSEHQSEHQSGHQAGQPATGPTKSIKPAGPSTPSTPGAATKAQLDALCRPAIVKTYPSATDDAVDAATAECVAKLTGRTLVQAKAQLDDLITDPDFATDVPDLGPAAPTSPTGTPTSTPTSDPSDGVSGTPTGTPSGSSPTGSSAGSSDPSGGASASAAATSSAG